MMLEIVAERLKSLREAKKLSQKAFAENVGMDARTYNRYELGERQPRLDQVIALARYYGVSMDYLCALTDDPAPPAPQGSDPNSDAH